MPLILLLIAVGAVGGLTAYFVTHPSKGDPQAITLQAGAMMSTIHADGAAGGDGCSSPQVQAAVRAFQKVAGLPVTGCYDGPTASCAQQYLPAGTMLPLPCNGGAAIAGATLKNRWGALANAQGSLAGLQPFRPKGG